MLRCAIGYDVFKGGHLHIKRYTAGTSNEISLDVLDAKRERLDSQKSRKGGKGFLLDFRPKPGKSKTEMGKQTGGEAAPANPKAQTRGMHAGAALESGGRKWRKGSAPRSASSVASNPLMPIEEVASRKRARHKSAMRKYIIGFGVAAIAVAVIAFVGIRSYQAQQEFRGMFERVVQKAASSDSYMVEIDAAMNDPLGTTTDEDRAMLRKKAVAVTSVADNTISEADALVGLARADQDGIALDELTEGARGRKNMVGLAMEAFSVADQASVTRTAATAAWDMVVSADSTARDAVSQANKATTTSQLAETTAALQQASDEFGAALVQLQGLESTVDGLDLSKQQEYLQKRIDTLGYAIATNEALAAGDRQTAAEQNELYEEGDRVSADLARSLPPSIEAVVDDVYRSEILAIQARYDKERERVSTADSRVRHYLGI